MHHALGIEEILLNIFVYCQYPLHGSNRRDTSTLASLARTCHTFKEPALDLLWEWLENLSPLARCLPNASYRLPDKDLYALSRPLTKTEWITLESYTRRIRVITGFYNGLEWESAPSFLNPPTTQPLFPNLRILRCDYAEETKPLLHLPLPSLVSLEVTFENPHLFHSSLESFPVLCHDLRELWVSVNQLQVDDPTTFSKIEPNYLYRWENLTSLGCPEIALNAQELAYLSRMPALSNLGFALTAALSPFDTPLVFGHLDTLTLYLVSWESMLLLLSQTRLPAIKTFTALMIKCPSKRDLYAFWDIFQSYKTGDIVEELRITQPYTPVTPRNALILGLQDVQPCVACSNLRVLEFSTGGTVGLTDDDLLALTSASPRLEKLLINSEWGWNTPVARGITPNALRQVLQACQSLRWVHLAIDTRGYTKYLGESVRWMSPPPWLSICVLDSVIEAESVTAIATFFASIAPPNFFVRSGSSSVWITSPDEKANMERWEDVARRVKDALAERFGISS